MNRRSVTPISWVLALLPLVLLAALYGRLPSQIPLHWGLDGAVSYGTRAELWLIAGLSPLLLLLLRVLPRIDPRKKNYARFQPFYDGFCLVMMLFLLAMDALILLESFWPGRISVGRVITLAVGLLFVFLGNWMPKVKPTFFMGIRTPWTLSDPDVWNKTHRLGGHCFFLLGLALAAGSLCLPELVNFILMIIGVAVTGLVPAGLSYVWYQKSKAVE